MTPTQFQQIDKLYQYTKFDSAIRIILSEQLKFGRLGDMNDVNEAYKHISFDHRGNIKTEDVQKELKLYRQISLTMDSSTYQGFDISAMWGHYAEKGKGVCLVFDKRKLLKYISPEMYSRKVNYKRKFKGNVRIDSENIAKSLERRRKEFFFTKSSDWKYEQEFRVITKVKNCSDDLYLDFKDSLIAIILQYSDGCKNYVPVNDKVFSSLNFKILDRIVKRNLLILEYGDFFGEVTLCDSKGGILQKMTRLLVLGIDSREAHEVTPKVWTKNFWGFFMRKKHDYEALLKYMRMLEDGFSIDYIHNKFGINAERLKCLWLQYQEQGTSALHRKKNIRADGVLKQQIVSDIEKNHLTLVQASLKYGVSSSRLGVWLKIAREQGFDALLITKKRGRLPGMGRPRKKKPEEMTELERLREENEYLRTENALLKKVKALVEEREARLREIGQKPSKN